MSTYYGPSPLPPEAKPSKQKLWQKKWFAPAALGFGMLLVGIGIGGSGKDEAPAAAPQPAVTVTATPSPAPTVTKEVEVTPAACLKALDLSEQGFTLSAEAMGYMSDALTAAGNFDVASMKEANANLDSVSPRMKELTTPMKAAATECRAGAR